MGQSSAVHLLHLRRLDLYLKRQGLHRTAHTLERESLVLFDAAHLQKLVREGRWSAACAYLRSFSPLWEPQGEGTNRRYTALLRSLFVRPVDDAFREMCPDPEVAKRLDLFHSMASAEARASVDWEQIKRGALDGIQELLLLRPDLQCSLRMRSPQHTRPNSHN